MDSRERDFRNFAKDVLNNKNQLYKIMRSSSSRWYTRNFKSFKLIPNHIRSDKKLFLKLVKVKEGGRFLEYANDNIKNDRNIVENAVRTNSYSFKFAGKKLKNDKKMAIFIAKHESDFDHGSDDVIKKFYKDKDVALAAISNKVRHFDIISEKLKKDKDILKAAVDSKSMRGLPQSQTFFNVLEKVNISDKNLIKYILKRRGDALRFFSEKFRDNRELVMLAVKEDGDAIGAASERLRIDPAIIKQAIKTGSKEERYPTTKRKKLTLPEDVYWHLKNKDKKIITNKVKNVKQMKFYGEDHKYYWGEILNGKPHGNGFYEKYDVNSNMKKVWRKVASKHHAKYQKNLNIKKEGYIISEKYIGEWQFGLMNGPGELIEYYGPEWFVNYDGTPKIMKHNIGNFKKGKMEGKFKMYEDTGGDNDEWEVVFYKNDRQIKKIKKNRD
mgnify:CR=1 FL=1